MKLIFLVGKKRSGKDTTADFIMDNYDAEKYQLAGPIKDALHYAMNIVAESNSDLKLTRDQLEGINYDREVSLGISKITTISIIEKALAYLNNRFLAINGAAFEENCAYFGTYKKIEDVINNIEDEISVRRLMQALGTDIVVNIFDRMYWVKLFSLKYLSSFNEHKYFIVPDTRQEHELNAARSMGATVIHVVRSEALKIKDNHITEKGLNILDDDIVIKNDSSIEDLYFKINKVIKSL